MRSNLSVKLSPVELRSAVNEFTFLFSIEALMFALLLLSDFWLTWEYYYLILSKLFIDYFYKLKKFCPGEELLRVRSLLSWASSFFINMIC